MTAPFLMGARLARAQSLIAGYPAGWQAGALWPLLVFAQKENGGFLSRALLEEIATFLQLPLIQVLEVVRFDPLFREAPPPKNWVQVCTGLSCWLQGGGKRMAGQSEDPNVALEPVECLGACTKGPVARVDGELHEDLDEAKLRACLAPGGS